MPTLILNDAPERSSIEKLVALFNLLVADVANMRVAVNTHKHASAAVAGDVQAAAATTDTITLFK